MLLLVQSILSRCGCVCTSSVPEVCYTSILENVSRVVEGNVAYKKYRQKAGVLIFIAVSLVIL